VSDGRAEIPSRTDDDDEGLAADEPLGALGAPEPPELAPRSLRLGAAFCDFMLIAAPIVLAFGWMLVGGGVVIAAALVLSPFVIGVYQAYLVAKQGQTIGKRWQGIQIVTLDGSPAAFLRGVVLRTWLVVAIVLLDPAGILVDAAGDLVRAGLAPLSITLPVFGIRVNGLLWLVDALFIFGASRRCLHDYIAGTKVILK
jgi:uncharacterized RDD family membrane protein YckC